MSENGHRRHPTGGSPPTRPEYTPAHNQQIEETYRLRAQNRELAAEVEELRARLRSSRAEPPKDGKPEESPEYRELSAYVDLLEERMLMYLPVLVEYQNGEIRRLKGDLCGRATDRGGDRRTARRGDGEDRGCGGPG